MQALLLLLHLHLRYLVDSNELDRLLGWEFIDLLSRLAQDFHLETHRSTRGLAAATFLFIECDLTRVSGLLSLGFFTVILASLVIVLLVRPADLLSAL